MPNVGRPSPFCKNCRDRKVKVRKCQPVCTCHHKLTFELCDQKRPSCSQCIRTDQDCQGYRDPVSIMFKNESGIVAERAHKRYEALAKQKAAKRSKAGAHRTDVESSGTSHSFKDWLVLNDVGTPVTGWLQRSTPEILSIELMPSIEQQAIGFFIANYVAYPGYIPRGQYEWVPTLLEKPRVSDLLRHSVNAVCLAGLGNARKSSEILRKAQLEYGSALCLTKSAITDRNVAVRDDTLVAVIMLSLYENMIFQDLRSIEAWTKHVAGASALIEMRGMRQFKSTLAKQIFHQFYGSALLVALESGTLVHKGLHDLYDECRRQSEYSVHGRQWTTRMVDVMHDAINLNQDTTSDPTTMLHAALKINRELDHVRLSMPSVWRYENLQLQKPSKHHFGNVYSVYNDPWIAQIWNHLRVCRVHLYKVICENIKKGCEQDPLNFPPELVRTQKTEAEKVMRTTIAGIIATVPQIIGMIPYPTQSELSKGAPFAPGVMRRAHQRLHQPGTFLDPAKASGMIHLIWPIYMTGGSDLATREMRQWTIEVLQFIALQLGTRQAVVLAEELIQTQRLGRRAGAITTRLEKIHFFFDSVSDSGTDEFDPPGDEMVEDSWSQTPANNMVSPLSLERFY